MCLVPASKILTAKEDLLVYKCLDHRYDRYATPFFFLEVVFKDGMSKLVMSKFRKKTLDEWEDGEVHEGIHAYYDIREAEQTRNLYHFSSGTDVYLAIIPKGTKYRFGIEGDIVSEELIVFSDSYQKYKYCNGKDTKTAEKVFRELNNK